MKCNCSDWDDESPCPVHNPKMPQPDFACHTTIVVHICRRHSDKQWYYTIATDGIRTYEGGFFNTKKEAMGNIDKMNETTRLPS
jgi:hypothetical protein